MMSYTQGSARILHGPPTSRQVASFATGMDQLNAFWPSGESLQLLPFTQVWHSI